MKSAVFNNFRRHSAFGSGSNISTHSTLVPKALHKNPIGRNWLTTSIDSVDSLSYDEGCENSLLFREGMEFDVSSDTNDLLEPYCDDGRS